MALRRYSDDTMLRVVALVEAAARAGARCPSNATLAAAAGIRAVPYAGEMLTAAQRRGVIVIENRGRSARVIAAADGAWRTAPPAGWDRKGVRVQGRPPQRAPQVTGAGIQDPEVSLAAAVVAKAWDDMTAQVVVRSSYSSTVTAAERDEAIAFLTAPRGPWAEARTHWCLAAGVDPDAVRDRALAALNRAGAAGPKGPAGHHAPAGGRVPMVGAATAGVSLSKTPAGRAQPRPAAFLAEAA